MYELVPYELKRLKQWVCWQALPDESRPGKTKKVPVNPLTGGHAMTNNPSTWAFFDDAAKASKRFAGIGFMFAGGYFGVDIDGAEDAILHYKRGGKDNLAAEFIHTLKSYCEYSVSLKGIHILCHGALPPGGRRKNNVEMYDSGRFFVVTGLSASEYGFIADCTQAIIPLHEKYIGSGRTEPLAGMKAAPPSTISDSQILKLAGWPQKRCIFSDLYAGNWKPYFRSQSEADLKLCGLLAFFSGRDQAAMDRLFRQSGLMRLKWDRSQAGSTYGAITIGKAAASCVRVFTLREDYHVHIAGFEASPSDNGT